MALVAPVSFKTPNSLTAAVGYHAPITVTEALVKWMLYYKITPNWMIIPVPISRRSAHARQLDATPAEIGDVFNILTANRAFHVLISYQKLSATDRLDVFRPCRHASKTSGCRGGAGSALARHRTLDKPALVREHALRLLPETKPELVDAIAKSYRDLRIWDVNGGAGKERGDASIKFFEEAGLMKKDAVTFAQAFEIAPLEKVLKKIGVKK